MSGQLAALRALKNELIGAEQRKKSWIGLGIVPTLSNILQPRRRNTGKQIDQGASEGPRTYCASDVLEDAQCRLQAVDIIGSIAQGMIQASAFSDCHA